MHLPFTIHYSLFTAETRLALFDEGGDALGKIARARTARKGFRFRFELRG